MVLTNHQEEKYQQELKTQFAKRVTDYCNSPMPTNEKEWDDFDNAYFELQGAILEAEGRIFTEKYFASLTRG